VYEKYYEFMMLLVYRLKEKAERSYPTNHPHPTPLSSSSLFRARIQCAPLKCKAEQQRETPFLALKMRGGVESEFLHTISTHLLL
jgi:hypothetical protein